MESKVGIFDRGSCDHGNLKGPPPPQISIHSPHAKKGLNTQEKRFGWGIINHHHQILVGGFKHFFFTPTWGNDPIWLIFFKLIETTN